MSCRRSTVGLAMAWVVLRLVLLESPLQSPGQDFGILFIPLCVVGTDVFRDIVELGDNGQPSMVFGTVHTLLFIVWHFETASTPHKRERNILAPFMSMYALRLLHWRRSRRRRRKKKKRRIKKKKSLSQFLS